MSRCRLPARRARACCAAARVRPRQARRSVLARGSLATRRGGARVRSRICPSQQRAPRGRSKAQHGSNPSNSIARQRTASAAQHSCTHPSLLVRAALRSCRLAAAAANMRSPASHLATVMPSGVAQPTTPGHCRITSPQLSLLKGRNQTAKTKRVMPPHRSAALAISHAPRTSCSRRRRAWRCTAGRSFV